MQAKLARICKPKSSSGTLDVPKEVYLKWKGKGKGREELLNTLIKCRGCKAASTYHALLQLYIVLYSLTL